MCYNSNNNSLWKCNSGTLDRSTRATVLLKFRKWGSLVLIAYLCLSKQHFGGSFSVFLCSPIPTSCKILQVPSSSKWSELTLLQDLLHGLPEGYLSVAARQALPGQKVQSRCVATPRPLTLCFGHFKSFSSCTHSHLKQMRVHCRGAGLVVGVALPTALGMLSSSVFPQVFEGSALKAAPDLQVVGEQEKLPALLQFSLHLKPSNRRWH